jgi:uncharacterized RDD family membrane protein YckC
MKCPKCGYLGFETTDRCRNCQYDFSLASPVAQPDLKLHGDNQDESPGDFDLAPVKRQTDKLSATALDLDRLFGDADQRREPAGPPAAAARADAPSVTEDDEPEAGDEDPFAAGLASFVPEAEPSEPEPAAPAKPPLPDVMMSVESGTASVQPAEPTETVPAPADERALPFDDGPLVPPPAARPPLAVRRSTPEVPRNRPRTTRPVRAFDFESGATPKSGDAARDASETVASLIETPSLAARVGAGVIDFTLLVGIDVAVLYLTLRVTGLDNSLSDVMVLPPVPFIGFLALLGFGYMAAFTVAGGQTIGKMMFSLRVIGDDGRPVDAAGGMIRALGCMLVPVTLGLSYLPALFTSDHRAIHDRLAGTRVVRE